MRSKSTKLLERRWAGSTFLAIPLAIVFIMSISGLKTVAAGEENATEKLDASLIALDSDAGRRLLDESRAKKSYVALSMHFTTQENLSYCGVASSCMVLNATGIERPVSPVHSPYRLFTQTNLFSPAVCKVVAMEKVRKSGMTLDEIGAVLACHPLKIEVVHASDTTLPEFRKQAIEVLDSNDRYIICNLLPRAIKEDSGGHFSPIAAYHEGEDRFLMLDVARFKYPPVWVKAQRLFEAMTTIDHEVNKSRGYVIVGPKTP